VLIVVFDDIQHIIAYGFEVCSSIPVIWQHLLLIIGFFERKEVTEHVHY